jgi:uncharacterized protein YbaP (TraB family)
MRIEMKTWMIAALISATLAAPSLAQQPPPAPEDEGTVVAELVVSSLQSGPAWWKVKKGDSVVYVLGAPMAMLPKDFKWDQTWLDRRLDGAKALILPSQASIGLGDLFGLFRLRNELKGDEPLERTLPEPTRSRFVAARTRLDKDAGRYAKWTPVRAGGMLMSDYAAANRFEGSRSVSGQVRKWASRHKVPLQRETYKGMPLLKSAVSQMGDDEKALACLNGYLDGVEQDPARYRAAAEGWAKGDVRTAIDVIRGPDICNALFIDSYVQNSMRDEVNAISAALETPGKAVALVPLRNMVVKDGVLEQLRARGYEVIDPASLKDDEEEP